MKKMLIEVEAQFFAQSDTLSEIQRKVEEMFGSRVLAIEYQAPFHGRVYVAVKHYSSTAKNISFHIPECGVYVFKLSAGFCSLPADDLTITGVPTEKTNQ